MKLLNSLDYIFSNANPVLVRLKMKAANALTQSLSAFACNRKKLCNCHYFLLFLFLYSKFERTDESCLSNFPHLLS